MARKARTGRQASRGKARTKKDQAIQEPEKLVPVDCPIAYATTVNVIHTPNDITIMFSRPHPLLTEKGALAPVSMAQQTAIVQMGHGAAKDLHLLLGDIVGRVEEDFGVTETYYTRRRAADEAKRQKKQRQKKR